MRKHGTTHRRPLEEFEQVERAHLETFPVERAVAAAQRASSFGSYSYKAVENILRKGLDMAPLPTVVVPTSAGLERPRFALASARATLPRPWDTERAWPATPSSTHPRITC